MLKSKPPPSRSIRKTSQGFSKTVHRLSLTVDLDAASTTSTQTFQQKHQKIQK